MKKIISAFISAVLLGTSGVSAVSATPSVKKGDINNDGEFNIADVVLLQKWLINSADDPQNWMAGNLCNDDILDSIDLSLMKNLLLAPKTNIVHVTTSEELMSALASAKPGDEIVVAPGEYICTTSTNTKGYQYHGAADGTEDSPIILRSEDPESPAILSGATIQKQYALAITGDWWVLDNIKVTGSSIGLVLDNSNNTKILNCEVYGTGQEAIHIRDGSSNCLVENTYIHDTGLKTAAYGEGIYVGSSYKAEEYEHACDNNRISNCKIGPNVTAEHVDVKELTTGTIIENCTFDGKGIAGENYADSFVDLKGNDCILRYCTGYRNGETKVNRAFEMNKLVEGWGQNAYIYGNKVYMDTPLNSEGKKMVILNSWNCTETVWDNYMAYEDGELFYTDDEKDRWNYYNCNGLTYGDSSLEKDLPQ